MTKTSIRLALIGCAFVAIGAQAQAPPATAPAQLQPPQVGPAQVQAAPAATPAQGTAVGGLNLTNASLIEVINDLAGELKLNYVLDAGIHGGSVTINTFGVVHDVDLMQLLQTILRMNNLTMVQVGNIYRIIPVANVARQPIDPISTTDSSKFGDDEHMVLNLVFLQYMTSSEMQKILAPFIGDGGQVVPYNPANLLMILDNSRNMRRTLDLIAMFDSDTFAGQRVRAFEVKNGRPSDLAKELDNVFRAYSLTSSGSTAATGSSASPASASPATSSTVSSGGGTVQFVALDRINTILAVAPNPNVFKEVETWLAKLDIPSKVTVGSIDNHVYKLKYGRAEILGGVIGQLYGISTGYGSGGNGMYGGMPGYSGYPASGSGGAFGSPLSGYGGNTNSLGYPSGNGGGFGNAAAGMQGGQQQGAVNPFMQTAGSPLGAGDQTGTFLRGGSGSTNPNAPRIVPNPFDNTLLIQSNPQDWEQIRNLLDQLDVSPRQVLIDAKIYEVSLTGELSAGVEAFLQKRGATNAAGLSQHQLTGSSGVGSAANAILSAGTLVGQSRELLASLNANELVTKSKVLSAPSIIATDSIPASITVGDSVPTLSSQGVNPGVTSGGNSVFTNTISNVSTGVGLNILARVNASGVVTMVIDQSVTAPTSTTSSTINSPSFSQRNVSTQVTVNDGDTIAIGGIIDETTTETSQGIPFLDRIPVLGFIFGSKSTTKGRTELIIFLTPHVIYDTNRITDATQELKDKVKDLRKIIQKNKL